MVVTFDVWENGGTGDSGDSQCARKSQVLQPTYCNKQLIGGLWTIVLKPDKLPILFITTQASWPARTSAQSRRPSKWRSRWPLKSNISFLRNIWTSLEPNDIQVQTQQPYQLRTYAWCWAIPPKCSRYKIQMKTVFKTEVVMTFLGSDSDGFLITTFLGSDYFLTAPFFGSDGSKDQNSLSVLPRLHDQPQWNHLCSALQVIFFLLIISNFVTLYSSWPCCSLHWSMLSFVILLFQMIMIISVAL